MPQNACGILEWLPAIAPVAATAGTATASSAIAAPTAATAVSAAPTPAEAPALRTFLGLVYAKRTAI